MENFRFWLTTFRVAWFATSCFNVDMSRLRQLVANQVCDPCGFLTAQTKLYKRSDRIEPTNFHYLLHVCASA